MEGTDRKTRMTYGGDRTNARTIIRGLDRLIEAGTAVTRDPERRGCFLFVYYQALRVSGKAKEDAWEVIGTVNARLPHPLTEDQLKKEISGHNNKPYRYRPETAETRLSLSDEEIRTAGMTKARREKKERKARTEIRDETSFLLNRHLVAEVREDNARTRREIYDGLPGFLRERFSFAAVKKRLERMGIRKGESLPDLTPGRLIEYARKDEESFDNWGDREWADDPRLTEIFDRNLAERIRGRSGDVEQPYDDAVRLALEGKDLTIIGDAGTGKTALVNRIIEAVGIEKCCVVTPTGNASQNYGDARTIHSLCGLAPRLYHKDEDPEVPPELMNADIEYMIIDEISMVRVDVMEMLAKQIRKIREGKGKLAVIQVGDWGQLPPVVEKGEEMDILMREYEGVYSYLAPSSSSFSPMTIKLYRNHRVKGDDELSSEFERNLYRAKYGRAEAVDFFNSDSFDHRIDVSELSLCFTRAEADAINDRYVMGFFDKYTLNFDKMRFYKGHKEPSWAGRTPVDENLILAVGMKVMTVVNDKRAGYMNGSRGTVESLDEDGTVIKMDKTGKEVLVERHLFVDERTGATLFQLPVIVAAAITVHRAQGMTLDGANMIVNPRVFAPSLLYTGLSRVSDPRRLHIVGTVTRNHMAVDPEPLRWAT